MRKLNYYAEELIGLNVKVLASSNRTHVGQAGIIIDETKNMLIIERADKRIVKIQKKYTTFLINNQKIDGSQLVYRPYDRISRFYRRGV